MYTSSVYCFVLWLKCRHTLTVKQQDQLQEWCGCGVSHPALTFMLTIGLIIITGQFGRLPPPPFWVRYPCGAARARPHPGGCPWAANLSRLPALVAHSPPAAPAGRPSPASPHMFAPSHPHHHNKWKRLLGSWVNITILEIGRAHV